MQVKLFALLLSLTMLGGCAMTSGTLSWPDGAYPRQFFVARYEDDPRAQMYQTLDEYLLWVTRFYYGNSLAPGWLSLTEQVDDKVPPDERDEVNDKLFHLGGIIGSEWAKPNAIRRVNTRIAAVWRDALIESINQDDLDGYIARVEADVQSLIAGDLEPEDIYFERYYVDEFDF